MLHAGNQQAWLYLPSVEQVTLIKGCCASMSLYRSGTPPWLTGTTISCCLPPLSLKCLHQTWNQMKRPEQPLLNSSESHTAIELTKGPHSDKKYNSLTGVFSQYKTVMCLPKNFEGVNPA